MARSVAGHWGRIAAVGLLVLACGVPSPGQVIRRPNNPFAMPMVESGGARFYPDTSSVADALLRNAAAHARDGQAAEAIEIYRRVIDQFGDVLYKLPSDESAPAGDGPAAKEWTSTRDWSLSVPVRAYCQIRLAELPPEGRALYRTKVDPQAETWFRRGGQARDRDSLRKVVELAFCSSFGDDALELLGDLAFQDGHFGEALTAYGRLVPGPRGSAPGSIHPDPDVDLPRVAAKALLCRAAQGESPPTKADLDAFAAAYPKAEGALAGRKGFYSKILAEALASDQLAPVEPPDGRWPTFAGSPTRTRISPGTVDVGSFQWRVPLEPVLSGRPMHPGMAMRQNFDPRNPPGGGGGEPIPAYHPIVLNDQVLIGDHDQVAAYDLSARPEESDGRVRVAWKHDANDQAGVGTAPQNVAQTQVRYTLTAVGDRVFARLGTPPTAGQGRANNANGAQTPSSIVAVQRSTEGKVLWRRWAAEVELPRHGKPVADAADRISQSFAFEGTPVADERGLYVALSGNGARPATYVACLDPETGNSRWVRFIGEAAPPASQIANGGMMNGMGGTPEFEPGSRLLSLDGPTVYYQTNLGAVVALDAETGTVRWLTTYPSQDRPGGPGKGRDLNPAIIANGRVMVGPEDSASLFALDAGTGRLSWKTRPLTDVVHLLGVAKGRLIATGNHVTSIDAETGDVLARWPDNEPGLNGFGRGLLAGDQIYWPTRTDIQVLDQETGTRSDRPPIKLLETFGTGGGNLVAGDGYLIVAQPEGLVVFWQNSRLIRRYRDEIARDPSKASTYYRLAQVNEAVGDEVAALEALGLAAAKASRAETIDGRPLVEAARGHEHRLLMKLGNKAAHAGDWAGAAARFAAASSTPGDRDRLSALLKLSEAQAAAGDGASAVATDQAILADDRLRPLPVAADERRTVRADLLVGDRLAALLSKNGRDLYREYDRRAADLLAKGKDEQDPRLLEEVGRSYPVALVAPEALRVLGRLREATGRPADAAHAYKRLLAAAPDDPTRARALLGLGRAYQTQNLWAAAREALIQARARFGDLSLDGEGPGEGEITGPTIKVASLVESRLADPGFSATAGEVELPVPLTRRQVARWAPGSRPLPTEGDPPTAGAGRVFLAGRQSVRAVDPTTGADSWTADLGGTPTWVGFLADRVLVAGDARLLALDPSSGRVVWKYERSASPSAHAEANPFARIEPAEARPGPVDSRLHDFRVVGSRVFCRRGDRERGGLDWFDRELLAFDGDTGELAWSFAPAAGAHLGPHLWIGAHRIALQVRGPNALVVLDTDNGRRQVESAQPEEAEEWTREPLALDDDHLAAVVGRRTVALLDLNRAAESWTFRESEVLPPYGPPRLMGDAERLLVLHDGHRLIRLDPKNGHRLWSRPLGAEDLGERPESTVLDGDRFYWVSGSMTPAAALEAVAVADGATLWRRLLTGPPTGWALTLTRRCVIAFPVPSRSPGGDLDNLPLAICDRDNGALIQRVLLPAFTTDLAVRLAPRGLTIATQDTLWSLGPRPDSPNPR